MAFVVDELATHQVVKYAQPVWPSSLLAMLSQMLENQVLCDLYIKAQSKRGPVKYIPCHTNILAASSHLLQHNLTSQKYPFKSSRIVIECGAIGLSEWDDILQFIYKGSVDISLQNVTKLWTISKFLRIQGLSVLLEDTMKENNILIPSKWKTQENSQWLLSVYPDDQEDLAISAHTPSIRGLTEALASNTVAEEISLPAFDTNFNDFISETIGKFIDDKRKSESVLASETTEDSCCVLTEESKPKRRKMYKPRKVEQSDAVSTATAGDTAAGSCDGDAAAHTECDEEGDSERSNGRDELASLESCFEHESTIVKEEPNERVADSDVTDTFSMDGEMQPQHMFPAPVVIAPIDDFDDEPQSLSSSAANAGWCNHSRSSSS